ncbi:MAG: hypothetical protein GY715_12205, partial [Planctomycetes bacterium]|nr:hypothetical protein [Planctomycetota bacterium]
VDMDTTADWEQIDAVQLRGSQGPISQWADHVLGFSSHWSASSFSADQTLGAPDVPQYGNNASAWASSSQDGTLEQVTVGFATPVYATGVTVRETWGNGFVYRVEVVDMSDGLHTVWTGADPSSPGAIANFLVQWPQTTYLVKGVRVHVDTDATADWEEIDAIQLHGIDADIADCNGNGIIDTCDILGGASADLNADGIPDECVFAPGITSLAASPDPVAQGATVTLTASGVVDPNDDVAIVRFYHDADDDGALDGSDTLLGSDNDESGGWSWAGSTGAVPQGVRRFFARAEDGGGLLSSVVSVLATVSEAPDPGEWTGAPGGSWFGSSNWGGGSVPNAGTTVTIASSVVIDSAGALASSVTIQSGGTLTFASGGTLTAAGGVTIESGGTLTGVGTITGNVVNGGDVAPGSAVGTITVTGSYTQQASGRLLVEVDGYTPGSGHDVLSVGTSATFGGTVDVTTLGGFSPVDTSVVQFLTAASTSGVFGGASLPTLAGGFSFVLSEMATDARLTTVGVSHCDVASFRQWAGSVIGFSSQYSTSTFSAQQILGPPSVFTYGNDPTAWASSSENGTSEYVTLGFPVEVYATGVLVRETLGNGFVTQVDVVDTSDVLHTVWSGADPSVPGTPVDFVVSWSKTAYLVKGVRVYVDTDATAGWEEIDAIELHGSPGETEAWASSVIDFTSQWESHQFAAAETTGAPDVPTYSNHPRAWAASQANGTLEYLTVGFSTPMYATGVTVRETWGNGFVYQVDVLDTSDAYHTVWTGTDPSTPGSIAEYKVTWTQTSYPVKGVRVHIDTDATSHFEEVDAIKLHGVPAPEGSWATSVIGFSSEWSGGVFSAQQVVGAPNVLTYGNNGLAWASSSRDGTSETLTMGYHTPLYASAVTVRETWGNGFVTQIDLLDTDDAYHTVWSGTDTSTPGLPADFRVSFTETAYLAKGVRVHVDTDATAGWEEIDAVLLHGRTSVAGDCNGNGIADACDIAVGTSLDVNVNGIPDECEAGPAASVFAAPNGFGGLSGDLTGDLTGNPIDTLFDVLEGWGACRSIANCPGDLDGNGYVDADDLFAIWAGNGWGR